MDIFLATLFSIVCILLVIVVLLQKGRGVGLSGAFGGAGQSAFGTRTGDVFTWVTIILVAVFLLLSVVTSLRFRPHEIEQLDTPTFYPPPGPISKPVPVTIRYRPSGAKVYYSLDGSRPTGRSAREYDAPILVPPGTTILAQARLGGWRPSEVAEAHYPLGTATQPSTRAATAPSP